MDWLKKLFPKYRCNTGGLKLLGIFIFLSPFFIWPITQVRAATAGPNSPSTNAEDSSVGTVNWNHPDYDQTSDDNYATSQGNMNDGEVTVYLKATNFGFSIPAGATIDGISVNVERQANDTSFFDNAIRIVKGGEIGTTDRSISDVWPANDDTATYGGTSDLWGETWTDADINSANFGFAISVQKVGGSKNKKPSIDWINITVAYTPPDTTAPSVPGIPQATIGSNLTSQDWNWTASTDTGGSGMKQYNWRVDSVPSGTTYTGTTAIPTVTTNLPVGNWKFCVKAEDNNGNQSAENSSFLSVFSSSIYETTVDCSVPLFQIVAPGNIFNPVVDLSPITTQEGELLAAEINCGIILKSLLPSAIVVIDVPMGAVIQAPVSLWSDKVIIPPIATSPPPTLLPAGTSTALGIMVGHRVTPLSITKGVRIFLSGQAWKRIGYISNNVFREITDICADDSQTTGDALPAGQDCKINSGSDLVIWTKHFTEFVTYDLVPSSTNTFSNSLSGNSSSSAPGCGNSITDGKPDLFEIRANDKTATLYFAPPTMPYNSFYIAYSRKPDSLEYGTEFNQSYSGGVVKQTINMLQPNTKYYFKIRAGNGCATGSWGNTMTAKTTSFPSQNRIFYKNVFTAIRQKVINKLLPTSSVNSSFTPKSEPTAATPTIAVSTPKPTPTKNKFCILWWCFKF
jgi:hypothetical protein